MEDKKCKNSKSNVNVEMSCDISPNTQELKNNCNSNEQQNNSSTCKSNKLKK
mgnify:CR=1 FL=1